MSELPDIDVIVLGFGPEPDLGECLSAIASDLPDTGHLILVDNGIANFEERRGHLPGSVRIVGVSRNLGFAGGCNFGADGSTAEVLVFVNSDAVVAPGAIAALARVAAEDQVGIATGCLRLADAPQLINSAGNPLHFSGITWAGHCGENAELHAERRTVSTASGGFFAVRREVWLQLGGFDAMYFAYHEDCDLSLRAWLRGLTVEYEPTAVAYHRYAFSKNPTKMFLLERNRLITVLSDYPLSLLCAALPALVVLEPTLLALAMVQGWGRQSMVARVWVIRHAPAILARRRVVQATRRTTPLSLAQKMSSKIEPPMVDHPRGLRALNVLLAVYWRLALKLFR